MVRRLRKDGCRGDLPLGRDEAYRSTVDAKTTASGALGEHQVDWTTLVEHRTKHDADYALLVAPNPFGEVTRRIAFAITGWLSVRRYSSPGRVGSMPVPSLPCGLQIDLRYRWTR